MKSCGYLQTELSVTMFPCFLPNWSLNSMEDNAAVQHASCGYRSMSVSSLYQARCFNVWHALSLKEGVPARHPPRYFRQMLRAVHWADSVVLGMMKPHSYWKAFYSVTFSSAVLGGGTPSHHHALSVAAQQHVGWPLPLGMVLTPPWYWKGQLPSHEYLWRRASVLAQSDKTERKCYSTFTISR